MNFWRRFFKKSKEYFLEFTLANTTWRVVTWNFDFDLSQGRKWSVETHGDHTMLIRWTLEEHPLVEFIKNKIDNIKKSLIINNFNSLSFIIF